MSVTRRAKPGDADAPRDAHGASTRSAQALNVSRAYAQRDPAVIDPVLAARVRQYHTPYDA
ncbi:MAG: hypothetical protein U0703_11875 [Anaerolineae bacterium]